MSRINNNFNDNIFVNDLSPAQNGEEIVVIEGIIQNIRFYNEENCFSIVMLQTKDREQVIIKGIMISPAAGTYVTVTATPEFDKQWGKQYKIINYEVKLPATTKGIEEYLGSGIIKGVGKKTAKLLVDHFGVDTLEIIEKKPQRLLEIHGIGTKRANEIIERWHEQHEIRDIMIYLQGVGISTTFAGKIYKRYGSQAVEIVSKNPYRLARDIRGIAFNSADKIAAEIGIEKSSKDRIEAGIIYVLHSSLDSNGHVYVKKDELIALSDTILQQGRTNDDTPAPTVDEIEAVLDYMIRSKVITEDHTTDSDTYAIYLNHIYKQEKFIAKRINEIVNSGEINSQIPDKKKFEYIEALAKTYDITLADEQIEAMKVSIMAPIMILTGGPGTGKTTVTKAILSAHLNLGRQVLLCSPTGRAAKRLSEVSGYEATTIHRMLEVDIMNTFKRNCENPLECDTLIIDEASMVDNFLAASILDALPEYVQIILIGDADQLPSVGAGNFLADLINSEKINTIRLTEIFRQAQSSNIVVAAHNINKGIIPKLEPTSAWKTSDLLYLNVEDPMAALEKVKGVVAKSLPQLGYDYEDIQILTPMQRSALGAQALNEEIRKIINPPKSAKDEFKHGLRTFRLNDRVMQTENDYDKGVFNGDIGYITEIDHVEKEFIVNFQGVDKVYDFSDASALQLAYALTIHKSQGSEYRVVVLVVHTQHYIMLKRQLLYTGLTRGKERVIIVGTDKAIRVAVSTLNTDERNSMLAKRIANYDN